MKSGKAPSDPAAMDDRRAASAGDRPLVLSVQREMHCGLADMYEADQRFQENIDKHGAPGLTTFLSAAIRANAKRSGKYLSVARRFDTVVDGRLTSAHLC